VTIGASIEASIERSSEGSGKSPCCARIYSRCSVCRRESCALNGEISLSPITRMSCRVPFGGWDAGQSPAEISLLTSSTPRDLRGRENFAQNCVKYSRTQANNPARRNPALIHRNDARAQMRVLRKSRRIEMSRSRERIHTSCPRYGFITERLIRLSPLLSSGSLS